MYKLWRKPRPFLAAVAIAGLTLALAGTASARAAATVTVCPSGCAFSQIAPALAKLLFVILKRTVIVNLHSGLR